MSRKDARVFNDEMESIKLLKDYDKAKVSQDFFYKVSYKNSSPTLPT